MLQVIVLCGRSWKMLFALLTDVLIQMIVTVLQRQCQTWSRCLMHCVSCGSRARFVHLLHLSFACFSYSTEVHRELTLKLYVYNFLQIYSCSENSV